MRSAATLCSFLLAAPLVLAAAPVAQAAPQAAPAVRSTPSPEGDRRLGLRDIEAGPAKGAMTSGAVKVPTDIAVIGVTWDEGTGRSARLAYRVERDGTWGPWQRADVEICSDCTAPGAEERAGSEPIVVTGAQRVEVRLTAADAGHPRLTIIDPDAPDAKPLSDTPFTAAAAVRASATAAGMSASGARPAASKRSKRVAAPAGLSGPRISMPVKRAGWRAARPHRMDSLPTPRGVVVHHTAGTNNYTREQVPGILRGIQRFHISDRGWADIGYNALIDRYGRVWEGRPGGVGDPHQGAHARGVNQTYLGFAYMGDTNKEPATQAGVDAMTDLIAWTSARYGFDAAGTLWVRGSKKPVVAGHYQVGSTSCPGKDLTARLPSIRARAAALSDDYLAEGRARAGGARR